MVTLVNTALAALLLFGGIVLYGKQCASRRHGTPPKSAE